jgi:hypothetical protein
VLHPLSQIAVRHAKAVVEGGLTAFAVAMGVFLFPSLSDGVPNRPPEVPVVELDQTRDVPTYVLDWQNFNGSQDLVMIGMDTLPNSPPVEWKASIFYAGADRISSVTHSPGVSRGYKRLVTSLNKEVTFEGTTKPNSDSYTHLHNGIVHDELTGQDPTTDSAWFAFKLCGSVSNPEYSGDGTRMVVSEPLLLDAITPDLNSPASASAPGHPAATVFGAEIYFHAAINYDLQGSGPTVLSDNIWDWSAHQDLLPHSLTGVDEVKQQQNTNYLAVAGVFFGVAAAAFAAFLLELVSPIQEYSRAKRAGRSTG